MITRFINMVNQQQLFREQSLFLHDMYVCVCCGKRCKKIVIPGLISLLFFCSNSSYSAELTKHTRTLCDSGYYSNGTCITYTQGKCKDSYLYTGIGLSSFSSTNGEASCRQAGYTLREIPNVFSAIFTGSVSGTARTLCDNGYYSSGKCITYTQGSCKNSYLYTGVAKSTFTRVDEGSCRISGYSVRELEDTVYTFIYNGALFGNVRELCGIGTYSGGTCISASQNECPDNYTDLLLNDTSFTKLNAGYCDSGYTKYTINQQCNKNTTDGMCAKLCDGDDLYTDIGTCANLCTHGATSLKTGTGLSFPLYDTKQTTPSINFQFANGGICYVNLLEGKTKNAVHIFNPSTNKTYHTVN